jgi:hypothetical protein
MGSKHQLTLCICDERIHVAGYVVILLAVKNTGGTVRSEVNGVKARAVLRKAKGMKARVVLWTVWIG